jgi:hypothetical protein
LWIFQGGLINFLVFQKARNPPPRLTLRRKRPEKITPQKFLDERQNIKRIRRKYFHFQAHDTSGVYATIIAKVPNPDEQ